VGKTFRNGPPVSNKHSVVSPTFNQTRKGSRDSSVDVATGYGFDSRQRQSIFLLFTASIPTLGSILPPIHWKPEVLSPGVKRQEREAHRSTLSRDEVFHFHSPSVPVVRYLIKHRGNFTLYKHNPTYSFSQRCNFTFIFRMSTLRVA
jgi:hypothetical protein